MSPRRLAVSRNITLLCQHCHGDLVQAIQRLGGLRIWQCVSCLRCFVYGAAGWLRVRP